MRQNQSAHHGGLKTTAAKSRLLLGKSSLVVLLMLSLLADIWQPVYSAPVAPSAPSRPGSPSGGMGSTSPTNIAAPPVSLDLSATTGTNNASSIAGFRPVNINVGGTQTRVTENSMLTPAQYAAVQQVLTTGQQSLILNSSGMAVAGNLAVRGNFGNVTNLVVPKGVSVLEHINSPSHALSMNSLTNGGVLSFTSTFAGSAAASITAAVITNLAGGVINAGNNVNLSLIATERMENHGIISVIHDLNVVSPHVMNTGYIESAQGNINLTGPNSSLNITGAGTMSAVKGNIGLSVLNPTAATNIFMTGGNYYSQNLNIDAGPQGTLRANVGEVSGLVNIRAYNNTFGATTPVLQFGELNVTGDPTYYNTAGSIVINNITPFTSTNGFPLALVAAGDVIIKGTSPIAVNTSSTSTNGGDLLVIAGANFTGTVPPGGQVNNDTLTPLFIEQSSNPGGGSVTGGAIDFTGVSVIDTSSTLDGGNGGKVTLIAYSGTGAGSTRTSGSINLGGASINTAGKGLGNGGDVLVIAGAAADPVGSSAINIPNAITTAGSPAGNGSFQGGDVSAFTAIPEITGTLQILNGAATGATIGASVLNRPTSIKLGSVDTSSRSTTGIGDTPLSPDAGNITLRSGKTITTSFLLARGGIGLFNGLGDAGNGGNGGNISISAASNITTADITSRGQAAGSTGITGAGAAGGNGGFVKVFSSGGNISITSTQFNAIDSTGGPGGANVVGGWAGGAGGSAGDVQIYAQKGTVKVTNILASGGGGAGGFGGATAGDGGDGGAGGDVTISGTTVNVGFIVAAGGGGGGAGGGSNGGGGGGGGAVADAGVGGNTETLGAGGGGGGGGLFPGFGGSVPTLGVFSETPSLQNLTGSAGTFNGNTTGGGAGGTFSLGGAGGQGDAGGNPGASGGAAGESGSDSLDALGGNGGAGGVITLYGNSVVSNQTLFSFYKTLPDYSGNANLGSTVHFQDSLYTAGAGGSIQINTGTSTVKSQQYPNALNLANAANSNTVQLNVSGGPFVAKSAFLPANGTIGNIESPSTTINTVNQLQNITTPTSVVNVGKLVLNEADNPVLFLHNGTASAAEIVALTQASAFTGQTLALDAAGTAVAGVQTASTFSLGLANVPTGGFNLLTIPVGVAATATTNPTIAGAATIDGSLAFAAGGTVTATNIQGIGTINAGVGILRLVATTGDIAQVSASALDFKVSTNTLVVSAFSNAYLQNTQTGTATALTINASNSGGTLSINNNKNITVAGTLTGATGIALGPNSGGNASIALNASLLSPAGTVTLATSGTGTITQTNSAIKADILILSTAGGNVSLGQGTNKLYLNQLSLGATGNGVISITNSQANLTILASNLGNSILNLTSPSITLGGNVGLGSTATLSTGHLQNSGFIIDALTALTIQSAGQSLTISGSGMINSPSLTLSSSTGSILLDASASLNVAAPTGSDVIFNAPLGTVQLATGSQLLVTDLDVTINTNALFYNPASVVGPPQSFTVNIPATGGPTLGAIVTTGDLVLQNNFLVNTGGKSLLLLAGGNITSSGVFTINLSSPTTAGGSLYAFSGFNFTLDNSDPLKQFYSVTGPSASGGTINFGTASINTGSTGAANTANGGNIYLVAESGATNLGQVFAGSLTASSLNGAGGKVTVVAPGGVSVGAINASGKTAGGDVLVSGTVPILTGVDFFVRSGSGPTYTSGFLAPAANVTFTPGTSDAGAAVTINGAINNSSSAGGAGNVTVNALHNVQINGAITSTGMSNHNIALNSTQGNIFVSGAIDARGLGTSVLPTSYADAGLAGNLSINAAAFIRVGGSISTFGGTATGPGNGGNAGSVQISTSSLDNALNLKTGLITVVGSINATGGNAMNTTIPGLIGGQGNNVSLDAGAIQITLTTFANGGSGSVITTGGTGVATTGAGSITIKTYGVQNLPSNFNMTSTIASEFVRPGAQFVVGNATINGAMGKLIAGANVLNNNTYSADTSVGNITYDVQAGFNNTYQTSAGPQTPAAHTKVTPAAALALWQVTRNITQDIFLNAQQQSVQGPAFEQSSITVPSFALPQSFTSFVIASADAPDKAFLGISGATAALNLGTVAASIKGQISFLGTNNLLQSTVPLTLQPGSAVTSLGLLYLAMPSLTNNGGFVASTGIAIASPISFTLTNSNGGGLSNILGISNNVMPSTITINNSANNDLTNLEFQKVLPLTAFGSIAQSYAPGQAGSATTNLNLNYKALNQPANTATIQGAVGSNSNSLTIMGMQGTNVDISGATLQPVNTLTINSGALNINNTSNLQARTISITSSGAVTGQDAVLTATGTTPGTGAVTVSGTSLNFASGTGMNISAQSGLTLTASTGNIILGSSYTTAAGALKVTAKASITAPGAVILSAGTGGAPVSGDGIQSTSVLSKNGSITLTAGSFGASGLQISLGANSTLSTFGGDINLKLTGGDILTGNNVDSTAIGGNIIFLTNGNITGGTGNDFKALGVGTTVSTIGGGIELGAGQTFSQLLAAASAPQGSVLNTGIGNANLGTNVTINNTNPGPGAVGVVKANFPVGATPITLDNSTLKLTSGGGIVFDWTGGASAKTINMQNATFTVSAAKPVAFTSAAAPKSTDIAIMGSSSRKHLARLISPDSDGMQVMHTEAVENASDEVAINLRSGELFINPLVDTMVTTNFGTVSISKGAFAFLVAEGDLVRIAACSGPGHVTVSAGGKRFELVPGEELILSDHSLNSDEQYAQDGVGRRVFKSHELATTTAGEPIYMTSCEFSLTALLSNKAYLEPFRHPVTKEERTIAERLIKTAAVLQQITGTHGPYAARKAQKPASRLRPVSY